MNKYHYQALVDLIFACTFVILAGQLYDHGNAVGAYAFAAYSGLKLIFWMRNEVKAKAEARKNA